jgi:hypothetical protein
VQLARAETARAALVEVDAAPASEMLQLLRRKYQSRVSRAEHAVAHVAGDGSPTDEPDQYVEILRRAQQVERRTLFELRARGVIGDDAFHRVEEELDWAELNRESMSRPG